jgi:NAD(P)-dependent dehydrogenase (short-subunit alcohol dehydrogenase family)
MQGKLGGEKLFALVNNAGTGLAHKVSGEDIMTTNYDGTMNMTNAFLPMINPDGGRVVNVGSGAGPMYVKKQDEEAKQFWSNPNVTLDQLNAKVTELRTGATAMVCYGLSKAAVSSLTMVWAKQHPGIVWSSISPGFIDTAIVAGFGAKLSPKEGTVSIRHCLFSELKGNGFYYGSDAVRSPLSNTRNPGDPEYTGN